MTQNLDRRDKIVNPDGTPSELFMRLVQTQGSDVQRFIDAEPTLVTSDLDLIAGAGLTGGGTLAADRTFAVGAGTGITVNADEVAIDTASEAERIRDVIAAALVAGSNITITVDDGANTITLTASGGGGGDGLFFDTMQTFGQSASGTAFATKGTYITPLADMAIDSLVAAITLVSGATYRARVYQVSGKSTAATITAIVDDGVDYVAPAAATLATIRLSLSAPVTLLEGVTYVLAVSRTDGGATYALPLGASGAGSGLGTKFPAVYVDRCQIPLATPIVTSVTSGYVAAGYFSVGIIGDPSTLVTIGVAKGIWHLST